MRCVFRMLPVCYVLAVLFAAQLGEGLAPAHKSMLSASVPTRHSLEGALCAMAVAGAASLVLYACLGVMVYGPSCASRDFELECRSKFVALNAVNHGLLGAALAMQAVLGSLLVEMVLSAYEGKRVDMERRSLLWMRCVAPFIGAFPVAFYFLLTIDI